MIKTTLTLAAGACLLAGAAVAADAVSASVPAMDMGAAAPASPEMDMIGLVSASAPAMDMSPSIPAAPGLKKTSGEAPMRATIGMPAVTPTLDMGGANLPQGLPADTPMGEKGGMTPGMDMGGTDGDNEAPPSVAK